jgi:hypothetical protein
MEELTARIVLEAHPIRRMLKEKMGRVDLLERRQVIIKSKRKWSLLIISFVITRDII